ncbi:hypothetical protein [Nonomuraea sp. NPDC049646]|uniref:hypothetical protein n=1 Tax=unclassified Nonomuraea TaxID=2593643 RepID=UPI0037A14BDF
MAKQKFAINTEPHVAEIGDDIELLFKPETMGDEFLDAWHSLQETYRGLGIDPANIKDSPADVLRIAGTAVRRFIAGFMLPDSARLYAWWEVQDKTGKVVFDTGDPDEAATHAEKLKGATVVDVGLKLPERIHIQLMQWLMEVYGQRPTMPSPASATPSPPPGPPGTVTSRSGASTRARGRSRAS